MALPLLLLLPRKPPRGPPKHPQDHRRQKRKTKLFTSSYPHPRNIEWHLISSSHIFIAYLHCISLLHFFIAYLHCISCLHIFIAYLHCIYLLQIFIAYLHCISLLHIVIAYLHCISLLYGGRLRFFAVACRSRSLAVFAVACRLRSLALFIEMLHCLRRHRCVPKMAFPEIQKNSENVKNAYLNAKHYKFQINFFRFYFSPLKFLGWRENPMNFRSATTAGEVRTRFQT